jgi:hypothetical protein
MANTNNNDSHYYMLTSHLSQRINRPVLWRPETKTAWARAPLHAIEDRFRMSACVRLRTNENQAGNYMPV